MPDGRRLDATFAEFDGAPVHLRRTNRKKTISIGVQDGAVMILAPRHVPNREIRELIDRKTEWLRKTLEQHVRRARVKSKRFVDGERFSYLGKEYRLRVLPGIEPNPRLRGETIEVHVPLGLSRERLSRSVRAAFLRWYKERAEAVTTARTTHFAGLMDVRPRRISLKDYKSMWGKCTAAGAITYNWKLIMAPPPVVDYIVVHELAHLRHLDHSRRFWDQVEAILPDYRAHRDWLKLNGHLLTI